MSEADDKQQNADVLVSWASRLGLLHVLDHCALNLHMSETYYKVALVTDRLPGSRLFAVSRHSKAQIFLQQVPLVQLQKAV